jgi:MFS family permease
VLAGARLILADRGLRLPVLAGTVSLIGIGIVDVASYPLSLDLGGGSSGYGAMTALLGGGGLVGAALASRSVRRSPGRALVVAFVAGTLGLLIAGLAPVLLIALTGMGIAGAGRGLGDVAAVTIVQAGSLDEVRSRVFAACDGAAHVAFSVSAFTGGLLVTWLGARGAFIIASAFGLAAALIAARSRASTSHSA